MRKILAFMFFVFLGFSFVPIAIAEDASAWTADKAKLEKIKDCSEYWDILWPWAKKGNLEARYILLFLMLSPIPDTDRIFSPGNSGDLVTSRRDWIIFLIHINDYKSDDYLPHNTMNDIEKVIYEGMGFRESLYSE